MDAKADLRTRLSQQLPLVAILRGVRPEEVIECSDVLMAAGFRVIEVPMNSPRPLESIERLARHLGHQALVGAGTVTATDEVDAVVQAGGRLIISPHFDKALVEAAQHHGIACLPGVFTPTEMFAAIRMGCTAAKLFPAEAAPPLVVKALSTVLPRDFTLLPVGGITPTSMHDYFAAGAGGFGLGGALYRPGISMDQLRTNANAFAQAYAEWVQTGREAAS